MSCCLAADPASGPSPPPLISSLAWMAAEPGRCRLKTGQIVPQLQPRFQFRHKRISLHESCIGCDQWEPELPTRRHPTLFNTKASWHGRPPSAITRLLPIKNNGCSFVPHSKKKCTSEHLFRCFRLSQTESIWTPRFLSWSFQVLFGPCRY